MGGARPRRRPREGAQGQQEGGGFQTLLGLLPILLFFILPMITSFFSGESSSTSAGPRMVYDNPIHPYTERRTTPNLGVEYFVNPADVSKFKEGQLNKLDRTAERNLAVHLKNECENELMYRQRLLDAAQGWFYQDPAKMEIAQSYRLPSCDRMKNLGISR